MGEQQNQRKEFDQVTSERNILGTQLIRRNDELSLLYEKIKIQKSTLDKGETQYKDRRDEIRALKLQVSKLNRNLHVMNEEGNSVHGAEDGSRAPAGAGDRRAGGALQGQLVS